MSGSNGFVRNSTIHANTGAGQGALLIQNASPQFENNEIINHSISYGFGVSINGSNASPRFLDNTIKSFSAPAVYLTGNSYVYLHKNNIELTSNNSVIQAVNASGGTWFNNYGQFRGENKIKGDGYKINVSGSSAHFNAGSSSSSFGHNNFCGNTVDKVRTANGAYLYIKYNYWTSGSDPIMEGNHINFSSNLGLSQCSGILLATGEKEPLTSVNTINHDRRYSQRNEREWLERYEEAIALLEAGKTRLAIDMLKSLVSSAQLSQAKMTIHVLSEIYRSREITVDELLSFLYLIEKERPDLLSFSENLKSGLYARSGDSNSALQALDRARFGLERETFDNMLLRFYLVLEDENWEKARLIFDELQNHPDKRDIEIYAAFDILGVRTNMQIAQNNHEMEMYGGLQVKEPVKLGNYPNPFNPVTQIVFELPSDEYVNLTVYDLMGREILQIVDGYRQKGNYQYTFDATNLASGLYIYRLSVGGSVYSRTMLLIK